MVDEVVMDLDIHCATANADGGDIEVVDLAIVYLGAVATGAEKVGAVGDTFAAAIGPLEAQAGQTDIIPCYTEHAPGLAGGEDARTGRAVFTPAAGQRHAGRYRQGALGGEVNLDSVGDIDNLPGLGLLEGGEEFVGGLNDEVAGREDVGVTLATADGIAGGIGLAAEGLLGLLSPSRGGKDKQQ